MISVIERDQNRFYKSQKEADEGFAPYFVQLYVNGVRAEVARKNNVLRSVAEAIPNSPDA